MLWLHSTLLVLFLGLLFVAPFLAATLPVMRSGGTSSNSVSASSGLFSCFSCFFTPWLGAAAVAGAVLALLMMCSHNFFHQQDNWRMYVFDLSPFSSYDWRITHAYSHHVSVRFITYIIIFILHDRTL
jgi:hypothetical protein